jgi:hypothetical protein
MVSEPREEPVIAAVEETFIAAVEEPATVAVEEPAISAVEEPAISAVEEPAIAAVEEPVIAAVEEPVIAAVEEPAIAAVEGPVIAAAEEPAIAAVEEPAIAAVEKPVIAADLAAAVTVEVPPLPEVVENEISPVVEGPEVAQVSVPLACEQQANNQTESGEAVVYALDEEVEAVAAVSKAAAAVEAPESKPEVAANEASADTDVKADVHAEDSKPVDQVNPSVKTSSFSEFHTSAVQERVEVKDDCLQKTKEEVQASESCLTTSEATETRDVIEGKDQSIEVTSFKKSEATSKVSKSRQTTTTTQVVTTNVDDDDSKLLKEILDLDRESDVRKSLSGELRMPLRDDFTNHWAQVVPLLILTAALLLSLFSFFE